MQLTEYEVSNEINWYAKFDNLTYNTQLKISLKPNEFFPTGYL